MPAIDVDPGFAASVAENRIVFSRSHESALRAMARATAYGQALERLGRTVSYEPFAGLPALGHGPQPEWLGKQILSAIGIAVPDGMLATDLDEAKAIAARTGYPVALKGQAAQLTHKTEAGAVMLGIADEAALIAAWRTLHDTVAARSTVPLDGVLVERMAPKGVELVIGARRDPRWGPVLMVGLGGILIEAIGDVRLMAADTAEEDIAAELGKLRGAKMLHGFRGLPPVDIAAVARAAAAIGRLMLTLPQIVEIDVNPIFAGADGVTAVDALIVTAPVSLD